MKDRLPLTSKPRLPIEQSPLKEDDIPVEFRRRKRLRREPTLVKVFTYLIKPHNL